MPSAPIVRMTIHEYFPTLVYTAALQTTGAREFNRQLLQECRQLRSDDRRRPPMVGRELSGRLHLVRLGCIGCSASRPTFRSLERKLKRHVRAFASAAEWDLEGRKLSMTDCWINIMPRRTVHVLHLHPLVDVERDLLCARAVPDLPASNSRTRRLDRFMAAPPRKADARAANRAWMTVPAEAGQTGVVRELAEARSGAESQARGTREHQLQLQLVLAAAPAATGVKCAMPTITSDATMAVFLDLENIALGARDAKYPSFDIKKVLERLLLKGHIVVKKAYCDFDRYKDFKRGLHEAAFELIEIPHVRQSGKNSADIRMVVDALDLCYTKGHVDTFVIISGDSDFSPLVSKLRENAKTVIGVGVKNSTSDLFLNNCDEFIYYDDLVRKEPSAGAGVGAGGHRRDRQAGADG